MTGPGTRNLRERVQCEFFVSANTAIKKTTIEVSPSPHQLLLQFNVKRSVGAVCHQAICR